VPGIFSLVLQGVDESSPAYKVGRYGGFVIAAIIVVAVLFFLRRKAKK
jgi:hypothetical protein